jgi:hypothetical protein
MALPRKACTILHRTEALLSKPYTWRRFSLKGQNKRAENGKSYCLLGALNECSIGEKWVDTLMARKAVARTILGDKVSRNRMGFGETITSYNDKGTKKDVLNVLRKTMKREGC